MSVILFSKTEVYQDLADAYERLKYLRYNRTQETYDQFYKALRRLYFANVATYLCQYHDETPLSQEALMHIDPFVSIEGNNRFAGDLEALAVFLSAWGRVQYNLMTNDGERYRATEAA